MRIDLVTDGFGSHPDRIFDGNGGAAAMSDDAVAVDAEQGHASVLVGVGFVFDGAEGVSREPGTGHSDGGFYELTFQPAKDGFGDRLHRLEHDVSHKPVADHHLDRIFKEVVPLNIAPEVEV